MICFCLAYQCYGILVQPISWSDCWICVGIPSFLALLFIKHVYLFILIDLSSFFFMYRNWGKLMKTISGNDSAMLPSSLKIKSMHCKSIASVLPDLPLSLTIALLLSVVVLSSSPTLLSAHPFSPIKALLSSR